MARTIAAAYQQGELGEFMRLPITGLAQAQTELRTQLDRVALAGALGEYHRALGIFSPATEALLTKLAHPASRVVVTGQQAGALTGPAYSVHKGADAALLAQTLDQEERPVVALYWVASQDHDAAEVASATLLDFSEQLHHLALDVPEGRPIGKVVWQERWSAQIRQLLADFDAPGEYKAAVSRRIEEATAAGGSYADVFARLIHGLLGSAGVLVLDPMFPALARLMAPSLARELEQPLASSAKIEDAAHRLQVAGFEPQLRRPAGATNIFIEEEDGQRRLLRFNGQRFESGTREYSRDDLLRQLEHDPSALTPAAGLRPIVQDTLLPTLAFVVGPGEIAYGAQLREVYELHGLQQPLLWPRLSVTWLEPNVTRMLRRLHASAAEVQADPEGVLGRALAAERNAGSVTAERLDHIRGELEALTGELAALDPTLVGAALKTQTRTVHRVRHLQALALKALARAEDERSGQLTRLKKHLLPNGVPQEREMNFLTYLLKHGDLPLELLLSLQPGFVGELQIP